MDFNRYYHLGTHSQKLLNCILTTEYNLPSYSGYTFLVNSLLSSGNAIYVYNSNRLKVPENTKYVITLLCQKSQRNLEFDGYMIRTRQNISISKNVMPPLFSFGVLNMWSFCLIVNLALDTLDFETRELEIQGRIIKKTVLFKSSSISRWVLETWGDLLSLGFLLKLMIKLARNKIKECDIHCLRILIEMINGQNEIDIFQHFYDRFHHKYYSL